MLRSRLPSPHSSCSSEVLPCIPHETQGKPKRTSPLFHYFCLSIHCTYHMCQFSNAASGSRDKYSRTTDVIKSSLNQSIKQSINQSVSQSINQSLLNTSG